MNDNFKNLIWIDLEMTGLNPKIHKIIEIATLVTDKNLNILAQGPIIVIHQNQCELNLMNQWNITTHTKNGLINKIKHSLYDEHLAEKKIITFLKKWIPKNKSPMCGNSISTDRLFLKEYMPTLEKYFHYRQIDVSSIKELILRWKPKLYKKFTKKYSHQALLDLQESIQELIFYKKHFFQL
ncbi:MAG: oligoribonuclease [Buchnera aphidicola (Chaetogeoica yunlongensis)]